MYYVYYIKRNIQVMNFCEDILYKIQYYFIKIFIIL